MVFWAQHMLNLDLDGKYGDAMELGLFNSGLSGLSQEGTHYFYENKLESDGTHKRWAWHNCPCCTMNVSRLVASIGGYFYSTGKDLIAVHLYGGNSATIDLDGTSVAIREESDFPWSGAVTIAVNPSQTKDVHRQAAHPGLDQGFHRQDQWRGDRRRQEHDQGLSRDHAQHGRPATPSRWTCRCRCAGSMPTRGCGWMWAGWR